MNVAVDKAQLSSLMILSAMVEARDPYTGGHLWRVAQYSKLLAAHRGLGDEQIFLASLGGFMHDIGKVGVPDGILTKAGALDAGELAIMRTHPAVGRDLLFRHALAPLVLDAVTHHHERMDGAGYPAGLAGDGIPQVARLVAVADTFDAMTSTRPYRVGMPRDRAVDLIAAERGRQLDGACVDALLELAETGALDHVIGHSLPGQKLANCPQCGPVVVVPRGAGDGTIVYCRVCGGEFRLYRTGGEIRLDWTGGHARPGQLRLVPEIDMVEAVLDAA